MAAGKISAAVVEMAGTNFDNKRDSKPNSPADQPVDLDADLHGAAPLNSKDRAVNFRGCFDHSIDDKGRVSIPSTYRQLLEKNGINSLVLTNYICDGARCIEAYTEPEWRNLELRLERRSRFDPQVKRLENYYLARAVHCPLDGSGRINVPAHLRSYAGLGREVVFASTIRGFRIWDKRVWELIFSEAESALIENPAIFENVDRD